MVLIYGLRRTITLGLVLKATKNDSLLSSASAKRSWEQPICLFWGIFIRLIFVSNYIVNKKRWEENTSVVSPWSIPKHEFLWIIMILSNKYCSSFLSFFFWTFHFGIHIEGFLGSSWWRQKINTLMLLKLLHFSCMRLPCKISYSS